MRILLMVFLCCTVFWRCGKQRHLTEDEEFNRMEKIFAPARSAFMQDDEARMVAAFDSIYHLLPEQEYYALCTKYSMLCALNMNHPTKPSKYMDSIIYIIESHGLESAYPDMYAMALYRRGFIYYAQLDYNKAYDYYYKAKRISDKYFDRCKARGYSYNMAMLLYQQKKYEKAVTYFQEAYAISDSCNISNKSARALEQELQDNIGLCFVKLHRYDSALWYFKRALATTDKYKEVFGSQYYSQVYGVILGNMAKVYLATNQLDTAAALYKQSIALNARPLHELKDAELVQVQLAEVYKRQQNYAMMAQTLAELKNGLDSVPNDEALVDWHRLQSDYYEHNNELDSAFRYYKSYIQLRDSFSMASRMAERMDVTKQLQQRQEDAEMDTLKSDYEVNRIYLWMVFFAMLATILIVLLVYNNYKRGKKNVTLLTNLNKELSDQKQLLEKANQVKDKLFSVVSHDMKSPVNSLTSFITLLEAGEIDGEELPMYTQLMKRDLANTSAMIDNLLGWAASQMEGFTPQMLQVNLAVIVTAASNQLQRQADDKKITLTSTVSNECYVTADSEMTLLIVRNLMSNAIKFSQPGSAVEIGNLAGNLSGLYVKDYGIGISAEAVKSFNDKQMLELSHRRAGTRQEKGTGLGLQLCMSFAALMGGQIWLESEPGKGSCFFVKFKEAE